MRTHTPAGSDGLVPGLGIGDVRIDSRLVSALFRVSRWARPAASSRIEVPGFKIEGFGFRYVYAYAGTCMSARLGFG